jgi:hypothetical protein
MGGGGCAVVDLCSDRSCGTSIGHATVNGTSAVPDADLPPGVAFWRVRVSDGSSTTTSAVWEMVVPPHPGSSGVDTSSGSILDVNGDGIADAAVLADQKVYVYFGGAGGPQLAQTIDGSTKGFGLNVASAGDMNGDGYGDLAVASGLGDGQIYVYLGGPNGLQPADPSSVVIINNFDGPMTLFGFSLSAVGDVDGDGYGDLGVGESTYNLNSVGGARVFAGGPNGPTGTHTYVLPPASYLPSYRFTAAGAGDINGDGYGDVAVGEGVSGAGIGIVHIYFGGPAGLQPFVPGAYQDISGPDPANSGFGDQVACAGDINGDGYSDLVALSRGTGQPSPVNRTHVYYGTPQGLVPVTWIDGVAGSTLQYPRAFAAGDFDGDGFSDFSVADESTGFVQVYPGSATGGPQHAADGLELMIPGFMNAVGGDVDGDGYPDLLINSVTETTVRIYRGGPTGLQPADTTRIYLLGPFGDVGSIF